jgi:predicted kinase
VILIGVPGAGKTTFYQERFASTHVRISLDDVASRFKLEAKVNDCIAAKSSFVVDNTNVRRQDREWFVRTARSAGYRVIGYVFRLELRAAIKRNSLRKGKQVIPVPALIRIWKATEPPALDEGFDELSTVNIERNGTYTVEPYV